jgi:hypothetical protein
MEAQQATAEAAHCESEYVNVTGWHSVVNSSVQEAQCQTILD